MPRRQTFNVNAKVFVPVADPDEAKNPEES